MLRYTVVYVSYRIARYFDYGRRCQVGRRRARRAEIRRPASRPKMHGERAEHARQNATCLTTRPATIFRLTGRSRVSRLSSLRSRNACSQMGAEREGAHMKPMRFRRRHTHARECRDTSCHKRQYFYIGHAE